MSGSMSAAVVSVGTVTDSTCIAISLWGGVQHTQQDWYRLYTSVNCDHGALSYGSVLGGCCKVYSTTRRLIVT